MHERRLDSDDELAGHGFFICDADLEDELIRALRPDRVLDILHSQGDLVSFGRFQQMPAQRSRPLAAQLHRFMGTRGGRKIHYGTVLADALEPDQIPDPLTRLLDWI